MHENANLRIPAVYNLCHSHSFDKWWENWGERVWKQKESENLNFFLVVRHACSNGLRSYVRPPAARATQRVLLAAIIMIGRPGVSTNTSGALIHISMRCVVRVGLFCKARPQFFGIVVTHREPKKEEWQKSFKSELRREAQGEGTSAWICSTLFLYPVFPPNPASCCVYLAIFDLGIITSIARICALVCLESLGSDVESTFRNSQLFIGLSRHNYPSTPSWDFLIYYIISRRCRWRVMD